jgi:dipeptide transport system substrate-binding protein
LDLTGINITESKPKSSIKKKKGEKTMRRFKLLAILFTIMVVSLTGVNADAKTCVFCSEGSPEGFNPAFYTAGTTFDASSRPIFDRLVLFELGTTKTIPGLAEKWDISPDGKTYTFHLRKGVKFHTTKKLYSVA